MEESTLRWSTDKEREEMEEVCSIGEVPHTEKSRRKRPWDHVTGGRIAVLIYSYISAKAARKPAD